VSTVVTVMDRDGWDANTDVIVLAEPVRRRLLWVPRDTWCPRLGDRVNAAFKHGGHEALIAALAELGLHADHSLCLARGATRSALGDVSVRVPVERPLALRYPLAPEQPIEDGEQVVHFDPLFETLAGERVHQWIGARFEVGRPSSDLRRIARQQVFVRALLEQHFDFSGATTGANFVSTSGPRALDELPAVDPSWRFATLPRLRPRTIDGKSVLIHHPWWRPSLGDFPGSTPRRLARALLRGARARAGARGR
jgi:anionic cell wall polymer biosynthesis LytR-Cps2A-Psr (LCP) family protein